MQAFLAPLKINLIQQNALGVGDAEEAGLTFVENALLKARHASIQTNLPVIADDSGLVVHALNGAPGIRSARYAGVRSSSSDNIEKLLQDLKNVDLSNRQAFFYCALVFLAHPADPTPLIAEGRWDGEILTEKKGQQGFGYDPVFYVPSEKKTAAELALNIKNTISHRGKALRILSSKINESINVYPINNR